MVGSTIGGSRAVSPRWGLPPSCAISFLVGGAFVLVGLTPGVVVGVFTVMTMSAYFAQGKGSHFDTAQRLLTGVALAISLVAGAVVAAAAT